MLFSLKDGSLSKRRIPLTRSAPLRTPWGAPRSFFAPYSPECVEGEFSEIRLTRFLRTSHAPRSAKLANGPSGWHHSLLESQRVGRKSMSVEENKRLAREAIKILTTGDLDAADALYAPDYVNHQHHDPEDPRDLHGV